jgi:hypothetical protein
MARQEGVGGDGPADEHEELARELARVGVDWAEAARALAAPPVPGYRDVVFAIDPARVLTALRALPAGAGTAALVAALQREQRSGKNAT